MSLNRWTVTQNRLKADQEFLKIQLPEHHAAVKSVMSSQPEQCAHTSI